VDDSRLEDLQLPRMTVIAAELSLPRIWVLELNLMMVEMMLS
jgi:hypothetical protein